MNRRKYSAIAAVLTVVLVVLLAVALLPGQNQPPEDTLNTPSTNGPTDAPTEGSTAATDPTQTLPPQTQPPETEPSATEPPITEPPATQPPETEPPATGDGELIGSLYTRAELEALENEFKGYGPGVTSGGVRPGYPERMNKEYAKYDTYFIAPDDNRVYLTFNCGYEAYTADGTPITALVLDVLKEKNVKGMFFLCKLYCENSPELVQRMIDEGHIVANHGSRHKCMPYQTIDGMVEEIMELHRYVEDNFGYTMKYYRPSSGEFSTRVFAVAQTLGYTTLQYSFAYRDFDTEKPPANEKALATMKERLHNGAIYQLHTVVETTHNVLGEFIDYARAQGYQFALFSENVL